MTFKECAALEFIVSKEQKIFTNTEFIVHRCLYKHPRLIPRVFIEREASLHKDLRTFLSS